ncbi:COX assembly mitochondrial protein homolog [Rattus norvegicus]|uniref:COX assembly mitochondrial protein homolog n=1 Tax=Rattus norvegicus TaxID=10116 RepID=UPI0019179C5F|nr:COX assembly mitochondrial protein homolog [Rattus norvegicus]
MAPAGQHLRQVVKDFLTLKMREKDRERCSRQGEDFTKYYKDAKILLVKCQKEN